jgi:hypothetical protein
MLKIALVSAVICALTASALAGSDVDAWLRNNQRMEEENGQIKDALETLRRLDAEKKQREEEYAVHWCPSMNSYIKLSDHCPPSQ